MPFLVLARMMARGWVPAERPGEEARYTQGRPRGHATCASSRGPCLLHCSGVAILKFFIIPEQGALRLYLGRGLAKRAGVLPGAFCRPAARAAQGAVTAGGAPHPPIPGLE